MEVFLLSRSLHLRKDIGEGGWIPSFSIFPTSGKIRAPLQGECMNRHALLAILSFAGLSLAPLGNHVAADEQPLFGYSAESSRAERQWEEKLRAIPSTDNLRSY